MDRPLWSTFMQWRETSKDGNSNTSFVIDNPATADEFIKLLETLNIPAVVQEGTAGFRIITMNYFDYVKLCSENSSSITDEIMREYFE